MVKGQAGKGSTLWKYIKIVFELKGTIEPEKARRACDFQSKNIVQSPLP